MKLIAATRLPEPLFWASSFLGRSFQRIPPSLRPELNVVFDNNGADARGLSEVYNQAIAETDPNVDLVFVHDDVYLNDWFVAQRVTEALKSFDVVGVAGSVNPDLSQPAWGLCFDDELTPLGWQPSLERSGIVNHFDYAHPDPSIYGPSPLPCRLLDGLLLAVRTSVVRQKDVHFDSQFRFHCYDLDFCRTATKKGLRIGTWPIAVTHNSGGAYGTPEFEQAARQYLAKWREPRA